MMQLKVHRSIGEGVDQTLCGAGHWPHCRIILDTNMDSAAPPCQDAIVA